MTETSQPPGSGPDGNPPSEGPVQGILLDEGVGRKHAQPVTIEDDSADSPGEGSQGDKDAAPSVEGVEQGETLHKTRMKEVQRVAGAITYQKMLEAARQVSREFPVDPKNPNKPNPEKAKWLAEHPEINFLYGLYQLERSTGSFRDEELGGKPIVVRSDGQKVVVKRFRSGDSQSIDCSVVEAGDPRETEKPRTLSRADIFQSQLLAEKEMVLGMFEGQERTLMEAYLNGIEKSIENNSPDFDVDMAPQELAILIEGVADRVGLLTTKDLEEFVHKYFEKQKEGVDEAHVKELDEKAKGLIDKLQGKTLADRDSFVQLFSALDLTPTETQARADEYKAQLELKRAELAKAKSSDKKALMEEIEDLEIRERTWATAAEVIRNKAAFVGEGLNMLDTGRVEATDGMELKTATRSGNVDAIGNYIWKTMVKQNKELADNAEARRIHERRMKYVRATGLIAGGLSLAMAFAVYQQSKNER